MMPCVYCIGCTYYRKNERDWCGHPDGENCTNRKYWEADYEDDDDGEDETLYNL